MSESELDDLRAEVERLAESGRKWHGSAIANAARALRAEARAFTAEATVYAVKALAESAGDLDNGILVWDLRRALGGGCTCRGMDERPGCDHGQA